MDNNFLNEFDIVVLVIVITSSLLSLIRGFLREVFSIAAWIGAGLITFIYFNKAAEFLSTRFESKVVVSAMAVIGLYGTSLTVLSIINSILLDFLRQVRHGTIDRSLGLAFGLLRGFIIVSIIHYTISLIYNNKDEPKWLTGAKTYNMTSIGSDFIKTYTSDYLMDKSLSSVGDKLASKLNASYINSINNPESIKKLKDKGIFNKVVNSLPEKDQDELKTKIDKLGSSTNKKKTSELLLEVLVLHKNASEAGFIKKEKELSDEDKDLVNESIKTLEKTLADEEKSQEDEELPWMKDSTDKEESKDELILPFGKVDTTGE